MSAGTVPVEQVDVTQADALAFCNEALRNTEVDLDEMSLTDVAGALSTFLRHRPANPDIEMLRRVVLDLVTFLGEVQGTALGLAKFDHPAPDEALMGLYGRAAQAGARAYAALTPFAVRDGTLMEAI